MSVIAAKVYDKEIVIASDSILLKDELKRTTNFQKLQVIQGHIIGGSGSVEELSLMFNFIRMNHWPDYCSESSVLMFLSDFSDYKEELTGVKTIDNCYLMIVKGHLYEIDGFFVQEIHDYTAIGSGEAYALTALHLGCDPQGAVKTTCRLCCSTCEPVIYYTEYL